MSDFFRCLVELVESGCECATATLIDSQGSTPGKTGHRMIVLPGGETRFTIGGGPLEAMIIEDCLAQLDSGGNRVKQYRLLPGGVDAVGMVCGGTVRVFIEIHRARSRLLVFGAGHVGREVVQMAQGLDFIRVIADDRPEYLVSDRFDDDVERVHCPDGYRGPLPVVDERTHVILVTRCHETDREILARVAASPSRYLGMIGSRRKVETVLAELVAQGTNRSLFDHLHAPIGLDIEARTPREIAVSILAEVISVRNAAPHPARHRNAAG